MQTTKHPLLLICVIIFLFTTAVSSIHAQDSLNYTDSATVGQQSTAITDSASSIGGPSLEGVSKLLTETAPQERERIRKEEQLKFYLNILYGILGTIGLAVAAWFLNSYARKIQKKRDEEHAKQLEKIQQQRAAKGIVKSPVRNRGRRK